MKQRETLIRGLVIVVAFTSFFARGEYSTAQDTATNSASVSKRPSGIRIGPGDLIDMTVFNVPEMSQRQRVDDNGNYPVPLLGPVHLGGLTIPEAQVLVASKLDSEHYVKNSSVSLFISDFATQGVSVMGEVVRPGVYPVWGSRRLFDLIAAAGGPTARAGKIANISHHDPGPPKSVAFTQGTAQDTEANPVILPGDTIEISKSGVIYVLGEVVRPGGFPMDNDQTLTLMKAVALAQGTTRTAKLGSGRLVRNGPEGRQEIVVNLKSVMKGHDPDLVLQADDILYVPSSLPKSLIDRTLPGIVAAASTAVIYTQVR